MVDNIKNNYILKKIFDNLHKKKALEIIKNNKGGQKRLNININDYKKYVEIYSPIEIEVIPYPIELDYLKFINIEKKEMAYYHIYFNNSKKEIKREYTNKDDKVKKIKIIIDYPVKSFENLFFYCLWIKSISFKKFKRNNINNMANMFCKCPRLEKLDLTNFNTNNVSDMRSMFCECSLIKKIDLSNFNTRKSKI